MIINITHKTTIRDVQTRLRTIYPFLKIEFSNRQHSQRTNWHKIHWHDSSLRLLAIAKKPMAGWIIVHPEYTISHIKQVFENRFGLHVEFFRRQNDQWIEIAGTDRFTIEDQNEIGRRTIEKKHAPAWKGRELLL